MGGSEGAQRPLHPLRAPARPRSHARPRGTGLSERAPAAVRRAVAADAAKLALVGAASFLESFADDHPGDDLVAHARDGHGEAWYAARLADPACAVWIGETPSAAPVGYAVLTPATLPGARDGDIELKRIYTLAPWHGGGLGRALLEAVVAEARARNASRLLLAVYARNARARAFYARAGFAEVGTTVFMVGATAFQDVVMALAPRARL